MKKRLMLFFIPFLVWGGTENISVLPLRTAENGSARKALLRQSVKWLTVVTGLGITTYFASHGFTQCVSTCQSCISQMDVCSQQLAGAGAKAVELSFLISSNISELGSALANVTSVCAAATLRSGGMGLP